MGEVDVFVGYVLSVRNRSRLGFLGVCERCEREPELLRHGAGFVLYALLDAVVDRYFPVIDALEVELEGIEQRIFTKGTARASIEQLYALKQRAIVLKRAVAPLLEGVGRLHGGRVPPVCMGAQDYFRRAAPRCSAPQRAAQRYSSASSGGFERGFDLADHAVYCGASLSHISR